ncbi:MAG: helix-turn-helix domain-containing protein [Verrucomicrobiota bacterium]|jgi:hypothetical protein
MTFPKKKNQKPGVGGQHAKPYEATIEGKKCQVNCFDAQGNLVLADGQRYTCERLKFNPPNQPPDEPEGDIFGWRLLEAAKLEQWHGDWNWNDEPLPLKEWIELELQKPYAKRGERHPQYMTRAIVDSRFRQLPAALLEQVNGVAWFEHDDGAGGWNTPILLKSFRPLPLNASPKVEATKSAPDYFTSIKDAAKYAKVTERTIKNWKSRSWLKVEQLGRKIRIAKAELDKCIKKQ